MPFEVRYPPPPPPPRMVDQWFRDGIKVLQQCLDRINAMNAPVVQADLVEAMHLAQKLVRIYEPDAR
ncbi:hypothetical protein [Prauserella endophytica]|uniref:Uncharacterized protein n=1 Tax=Prauserella endophytica TaxID=1592324 RepID=A0ABY2RZX1_9PSEU|nr:hypothetical protein [Prauserella endophytica]TKG66935.1 hypothetical protein FCN18_23780 [Prauserella endophytica]